MASRSTLRRTNTLLAVLSSSLLIWHARALDLVYCSSQNTNPDYAQVYNQYQTNGACTTNCRPGGYAIAIVQKYNCWCANEAPSEQLDINLCNDECPGFGDHQCGNVAQGLFAYFIIDGKAPSGTAEPASTTRSVSTIPSNSGTSRSVRPTSVGDSSSLTVSATQQSSRTSSSSVASTTSKSTTTEPPTKVNTIVTTVTGQVRTVIITPSTPADSNLGASQSHSSGISTGSIVGIVLGIVLGIGLVVGLAVWFWLRRRRQQTEGSVAGSSSRGSRKGIPSRQVSQLSSAGLLNRPPRIRTDGLAAGNGPKSAESSQLDRRSLGTDQRLNPHAIYAHEESRLSNLSLQDNQDYSRQLRVANPDP